MNTDTTTPMPAPGAAPILPVPDAAERLRAIMEKQGTLGTSTFEKLFGAGADLWDSDQEFEQFLRLLRESRDKG